MRRWITLLALVAAVAGLSLLTLRLLGDDSSGEPQAVVEMDLKEAEPPVGPSGEVLEGRPSQAAAYASAPAEGEDLAPPLPQVSDRKIIRQARLELAVQDVLEAVQEVENIAASAGGFVSASSIFREEPPPEPQPLEEGASPPPREGRERTQTAAITIRVPASRYQAVLKELRGLAQEVHSESSSTSDVTEEFADLEARRRNLEATEARLLELLSRATTIGDILIVQDRINAVRLEIERLQGRLNLLNDLSDLATIEVFLQPFVPMEGPAQEEKGWAQEVAEEAWERSQAVLQALGSGAIVGGIVVAWLTLPGLAAFILWRLVSPRGARGDQT